MGRPTRLAPKPDLAAPGTAVTAAAGGGEAFVSGTSVAAARAAAAAVEAHRARPKAPPAELAAALIGSAEPLGEPLATGAGRLRAGAVAPSPASWAPPASAVPPALAEPAVVSFPRRPASAGWTAAREVEFFNPAPSQSSFASAPTRAKEAPRLGRCPTASGSRATGEPPCSSSSAAAARSPASPAGG